MDDRKNTPLADEVLNIFKVFSDNRHDDEAKWNRNYDAYKRINSRRWKNKDEEKEFWESDTNVGIARGKITSAYALAVDLMLRGGKFPFSLVPSPYSPEPAEDKDDTAAEEMENLIHEQLAATNADRVLMRNILAAAVYGQTWAKRKIHIVRREGHQRVAGADGADLWEMYRIELAVPGTEYVSTWNIFPDYECDDLRESSGIFHRQHMSPYQLRNMKKQPLWLKKEIDAVIKDNKGEITSGSGEEDSDTVAPSVRDLPSRRRSIRVLEFWGRCSRRNVEKFEATLRRKDADISALPGDEEEHAGDEVEVMVCIAGERIVRYARTEPDDRPFYRAYWEADLDSVGGTGVADNTEALDHIVNGAVQSFEDNKKLSGNVILALKERMLANPLKKLKPGTIVQLDETCADVRQAIQPVIIPDVGESLISLIQLAEKFNDDSSQIPKISQGISTRTPQTAFEISIQNEQAGKYMGSVVKNFDEGLIEPEITDIYKYNMADPDLHSGKGDYVVHAQGFAAFQNRVERMQALSQYLSIIMQNEKFARTAKFREINEQIARGLDLDAADLMISREEEEQIEAQEQQMQAEAMQQQQAGAQQGAAALQAAEALKSAVAESEIALAQAKIEDMRQRRKLDTAKLIAEGEKTPAPAPIPQTLPELQFNDEGEE